MAGKKFDPSKDIPDLQGKVILVTGANAGIGKATVRALAKHNPARIYLCARRRSAADTAAAELKAETKYDNIDILDLDLASLESVKKCAAEFNSKEERLDLLFLNAGVAGLPGALTEEGYEIQFGINHMGHALLTQLLMPKLLRTQKSDPKADVRIIVVSSEAGRGGMIPKGGLVLDRMRETNPFHSMALYAHSKMANIHFARKLSQLYPEISSTSLHPGVVSSDIWGKANSFLRIIAKPIVWLGTVDIDEGAKTQLWCATAPRDGADGVKSGEFYVPTGQLGKLTGPAANQKFTDELWDWTTNELKSHGGAEWPAA